jgi:hypothetical protein
MNAYHQRWRCEHCEQPASTVDMKYGQLVCPNCMEHWSLTLDNFTLALGCINHHRMAWQQGALSARELLVHHEETGLVLSESEIDTWGQRVDAYLTAVGKEC